MELLGLWSVIRVYKPSFHSQFVSCLNFLIDFNDISNTVALFNEYIHIYIYGVVISQKNRRSIIYKFQGFEMSHQIYFSFVPRLPISLGGGSYYSAVDTINEILPTDHQIDLIFSCFNFNDDWLISTWILKGTINHHPHSRVFPNDISLSLSLSLSLPLSLSLSLSLFTFFTIIYSLQQIFLATSCVHTELM